MWKTPGGAPGVLPHSELILNVDDPRRLVAARHVVQEFEQSLLRFLWMCLKPLVPIDRFHAKLLPAVRPSRKAVCRSRNAASIPAPGPRPTASMQNCYQLCAEAVKPCAEARKLRPFLLRTRNRMLPCKTVTSRVPTQECGLVYCGGVCVRV